MSPEQLIDQRVKDKEILQWKSEGLDYREIGRRWNCTTGNVGSYFKRALARARAQAPKIKPWIAPQDAQLIGGYYLYALTSDETDIYVGLLEIRHRVDLDFRVPLLGHSFDTKNLLQSIAFAVNRFPRGWADGLGPAD